MHLVKKKKKIQFILKLNFYALQTYKSRKGGGIIQQITSLNI